MATKLERCRDMVRSGSFREMSDPLEIVSIKCYKKRQFWGALTLERVGHPIIPGLADCINTYPPYPQQLKKIVDGFSQCFGCVVGCHISSVHKEGYNRLLQL